MNNIVKANRTIYTASDFAKESLIYLQEIGESKSLKKHTSSRKHLNSYLLLLVIDGTGEFEYNNKKYLLKKNNIVFIDCNNSYSHTSDNWTIKWIHFNGNNINEIYSNYISRDGNNCFISDSFKKYEQTINTINELIKNNNSIIDMQIYSCLISLLSLLHSETIRIINNNQKYNIEDIKTYIDNNYLTNITLDKLSELFYINKFYMTRLFKETYSTTIIDYINKKIITKAKELLRFTESSIEQISIQCNIKDPNYFSRLFKKIEGVTPKEYRKRW